MVNERMEHPGLARGVYGRRREEEKRDIHQEAMVMSFPGGTLERLSHDGNS